MADRIKGITVEINGDTTKLQSALKGVNSSLRESKAALSDVNKLLKMDPGNTELLKQKQDLLSKSIEDTKEKLDMERKALEQLKSGEQTEEVIRQQQALEREIISTEQSLKSLEGEFKNFGSVAAQQVALAGEKVKAVGGKISDVGKGIATAGAVITGAEVAIAAAGKGAFDFAESIASVGDAIDKNSQKMGVSAEFYQEWDAVLQHSGSSMESMSGTFKTLAKVTENTSKSQQAALDKLGLKAEQFGGSSEKAFTMIISKLQEMPEGTERAAIAQQLLGRGAQELGALLNTSSKDTQDMIDKLHELGGVMSNEAVKNSAAFEDELQDMQTTFQGVGKEIGAELLPSLVDLMKEITAFVKENKGDIVDLLKNVTTAISELIQSFKQMTPEQKKATVQIMGMIAALGPLITIIGGIVTAIGGVISGVGSIMTAAPAITAAISSVGATLSSVVAFMTGPLGLAIAGLIGSLAFMVNSIKECGITWADVWDGIGFLIQDAKKLIGEWFEFIKQFWTGLAEKAYNWGYDLIKNYVDGIKNNINLVKTAGSMIAEKIKQYIHFSEPDVGPLSDFHTYMPDMLKGLSEGINQNIGMLDKPMNNLASAMVPTNGMGDKLDGIKGAIGNMNTNVNVTLEGDAQGLFRMVKTQNGKAKRMTGRSAFA